MKRTLLLLTTSLILGCGHNAELTTPSAPSVLGTVTYTAGGSAQITGSQGYWFTGTSGSTPIATVVAFTVSPAQSDSLHPPFEGLEFNFAGAEFSSFPIQRSMPVGAANGASLGVQVISGVFWYTADSGQVSIRPLGGGYAHLDVTIWCQPYRFVGAVEVPRGT